MARRRQHLRCRNDEAHIPAERTQAQADPRLPRPDGHQERPAGSGPPPRPRAQAPGRLRPQATPDSGLLAVSSPLAFDSARKLPDKAAFDRVFSRPDYRLRRHPFMLLARHRPEGPSRLGLVVGKKHARRAVARNRIRRTAREQFRHMLGPQGWRDARVEGQGSVFPAPDDGASSLSACSGIDVILMARPGAAGFDRRQLAEIVRWLFERLLQESSVVSHQSLLTPPGGPRQSAWSGRTA